LHVEIEQLGAVLTALGCPAEKSVEMASQLDKRARQLAQEKGQIYDEALAYLLGLMRQGWAAKDQAVAEPGEN
jgi:cell division protein ZapA (FtsZ GTPase activity inhibitor)